MIEAVVLKTQLERLRILRQDASSTSEDRKALLMEARRILKGGARSAEHLRRAIDHIIHTAEWMPAPAKVHEALLATDPDPGAEDAAEYGCDVCGWNGGWVIVRRGQMEGAAECVCRREEKMGRRVRRLARMG